MAMQVGQLDLDATPVWERNMNPEQLAAIRHTSGPCRLLAQAGSGKTRALVHRIARLVAEGVDPSDILAVTFSKGGAEEMNERLKDLGVKDARVGTWHSLCLQILKEDKARGWDWEMGEGVDGKAKTILKEVLGYKHMNWKDADLGEVQRYIGWCKAHLADPGSEFALDAAADMFHGGTGRSDGAELADEAHTRYQAIIEERGLLTFDDFLVFAYKHLSIEENRAKWAARWNHVLQDEAQDENLAQKTIAELLARDHRNYMKIGDTAQSIFAFRGSSPTHLANFEQEWPDAVTIIMNRNYRSGSAIVDAANKIIAPAAVRIPTDMVAERGVEGSVKVQKCEDLDDEGAAFAAWIYELVSGGQPLSSICALFRTNAQSRALEEALLNKRIPYQVVGGTSFYNRREVRDLLAYLRVAAGRDEGDDVKRCINAPFRYLGSAFVERVQDAKGPLTQRVLRAAEGAGIQRRQKDSALEWVNIVEGIKRAIEQEKPLKPSELLNGIINRTGYVSWLEREQGEESIDSSHAANVRELVRISERFDTVVELLDYLDEMEAASRRKNKNDKQEKVLLMSIHKSKGLEWPHVWVCGCNELVLPHGKGDPEEERRLMYVATTRARDALVLSYVRRFAMREGVREAEPSRFLRDAGLL